MWPLSLDLVQPGDLVMTLGAGNVWMAGVELVQELLRQHHKTSDRSLTGIIYGQQMGVLPAWINSS